MKDGVPAQAYVDLELLNKQLSSLEQNVQLADQELEHTLLALAMLEEFEQAKEDQEILIPLGSGAFCSVQAGNINTIRMAVGAGVLVDRTPQEARKGLQDQVEQLKAQRAKSLQLHDQVIDQIVKKQEEIEKELS